MLEHVIYSSAYPQLVVITRAELYTGEAEQINELLLTDERFLLHLRKPGATAEEYSSVLQQIPHSMLHRITLGDHFELAEQFPVGGVHLSGRQFEYTGTRKLRISRSCHTFNELQSANQFDYVFFSPIFNSISKQGYNAAFSDAELLEASEMGLINGKVIALGGVDADTLPLLKPYAFGGAAVLGTVWEPFSKERFKLLVDLFYETFSTHRVKGI